VLVTADVRGIIRANTWTEAKPLNSFHVTNGGCEGGRAGGPAACACRGRFA
jgi:hypothetical protein